MNIFFCTQWFKCTRNRMGARLSSSEALVSNATPQLNDRLKTLSVVDREQESFASDTAHRCCDGELSDWL